MNMSPTKISVQGEAIIPKQAERAVLDVGVSAQGANKAWVTEQVTTAAKHLRDLLSSMSASDESEAASACVAIAHWNMNSLRTQTTHPTTWTNNGQMNSEVPEHTASVTFNIRVRDFAALGSLATKLVGMTHVKINNVSWILTEPTKRSFDSELRKLAAKDSRRRAEDYADALELGQVRPVEVSEFVIGSMLSGNMMVQQQQRHAKMGAPTRGGMGSGGENEFDNDLAFQPEEVRLHASVNCIFTAE